jgi:hypothetical protein
MAACGGTPSAIGGRLAEGVGGVARLPRWGHVVDDVLNPGEGLHCGREYPAASFMPVSVGNGEVSKHSADDRVE